MENISILDGLILTIVSMLVVFVVLASIWGLVELTARFIPNDKTKPTLNQSTADRQTTTDTPQTLEENKAYQQAAEFISLVLASEGQSDRKFEIVESKRIK